MSDRSRGVVLWGYRVLAGCACVLGAWGLWVSYGEGARLRAQNTALRAAAAEGFEAEAFRVPVSAAGWLAWSQDAKKIVLIARRNCSVCDVEIARWTQLIEEIDPAVPLELVAVAIDGSAVFEPLRRKMAEYGRPVQVVADVSPVEFARKTGLNTVPTLLVLNEAADPLVVASGYTSDHDQVRIRNLISSHPVRSVEFLPRRHAMPLEASDADRCAGYEPSIAHIESGDGFSVVAGDVTVVGGISDRPTAASILALASRFRRRCEVGVARAAGAGVEPGTFYMLSLPVSSTGEIPLDDCFTYEPSDIAVARQGTLFAVTRSPRVVSAHHTEGDALQMVGELRASRRLCYASVPGDVRRLNVAYAP